MQSGEELSFSEPGVQAECQGSGLESHAFLRKAELKMDSFFFTWRAQSGSTTGPGKEGP